MNYPKLDSIEPITSLLPLKILLVQLKLHTKHNLGVLHHIPLSGWLRNLVNGSDEFSQALVIDPIENSHHSFDSGDIYQFRIVFTPKGQALVEDIIKQLIALPNSANHLDPTMLFSNKLSLHALKDGVSDLPFHSTCELQPIGLKAISNAIDTIRNRKRFTLRFLTPAILRCINSGGQKGNKRYCRNRDDLSWPVLTERLSDSFIRLIETHSDTRYQRPSWPHGQAQAGVTIWHEYRYQQKKHHNKTFGGVLTELECELNSEMSDWQLALLYIGQYLGIGQSRSFGFGLYQIAEFEPSRFYPSHHVLNKALNHSNLANALQHNVAKHGLQGKSHQYWSAAISAKAMLIAKGQYEVPPLNPCEIPRPDGKFRKLSIPPWEDRILQRSLAKVLSNGLDGHWIKHSYGYRSGHSRYAARDVINKKIQQGFHWIVEADIQRFFDNVSWENLYTRLTLIYPNDSELVRVIMAWISAPIVSEDGERMPRSCGLPQGSPISPVLANLIMDDFDSDMQSHNYELVRFADDFVLLFKQQDQAKKALDLVQHSLQEHGLELNLFKTRILHKRQGFRFLGFYFIDGYAIETKGSDNTLYELNSVAANMVDSPQCEFRNNSNSIGSREKIGTILVITGEITVLSACDNKLKTVQGDKEQLFSWPTLESVVLIGPHQITTPTLRKAMSEKVPIYFATNFGLYEGVCASTCPSRGANIWLQQAALFQRAEWQLTQAKNTVLARIDGIHHLIHRRNRKWHSLEKLIRMKVRIRGAQSIDEVRGHEGQASKLLWLYFKETLDPSWQFTRRNRRPPSDPINAMLSLGYTFLYNLCDTAIQAQGLYAWHGFYHQSKTTHSALASDLMEPFRVIVERVVLTMVNRHQIKTEEFATSDSGCEMSSAARKQFLTTLLSELTQKRKREQSRYIDEIFSSPKQLVLALRQGTNTQSWRP